MNHPGEDSDIYGGATKKKNVFSNQFKAWKRKNPSKRVNDLKSFAHYVLAHSKEFRKVTMNRAQSFANLSGGEMDGGKGNSFTRAFKKVGNSIKSTAEKAYDVAKPIAEKTYDIAKPIAIQGLKSATALGTNILFDGLIDSGLTAIGQPELIPVTQVLTQPIKHKLNNLTDRAVDKYVVGSGIHKMKKQELKNVIKHYNRHTKGGKIKHGDLRKEQLRDIVQNLVGGGGPIISRPNRRVIPVADMLPSPVVANSNIEGLLDELEQKIERKQEELDHYLAEHGAHLRDMNLRDIMDELADYRDAYNNLIRQLRN